ncbi:MarR family winged helix-turn-helix transcriptional regulator [Deinococcus maricopensis]|uniref:Transcriptional regulator, MarR family n=1 Tax=Deinococcus maricopensis (strain DSM 21211 / LMG 22137 / NRRL B-23946 / LB-34) TaxID=709986 RepID=E8U345_DEIML|nr:MarR family winged helix-turn-helix transcriptional regulator [Deinococcus maricopensis]ADV65990.1 transcriptional regulator, MarR family [Deinococcus maricopensis DSM 21211]
MPDTPAPDPTALAARYLDAFYRAREAFGRAIGPTLRAQYDLDVRDYLILRWIQQQHLTPGSLAELLHVPSYATSRLLDPFIKRGLVQRQVDDTDARRYRLHLTPEGRAVTQAIEAHVAALLGQFLHDLGPQQTEQLLRSLEAFARLDTPHP